MSKAKEVNLTNETEQVLGKQKVATFIVYECFI